jgi:hypothetical protein
MQRISSPPQAPCDQLILEQILARDSGRQSRAWSGARPQPQVRPWFIAQDREVGVSHRRNLNDHEMANNEMPPPASRASCALTLSPLGSRPPNRNPAL